MKGPSTPSAGLFCFLWFLASCARGGRERGKARSEGIRSNTNMVRGSTLRGFQLLRWLFVATEPSELQSCIRLLRKLTALFG
jgi:hypothetical protein